MQEDYDNRSSHEMATAHIVIKCQSDSPKDVMAHLKSVEGVVETENCW